VAGYSGLRSSPSRNTRLRLRRDFGGQVIPTYKARQLWIVPKLIILGHYLEGRHMKQVVAVASLTLIISVAAAQIPVPDLNQTPNALREQRISRVIRSSSFFSPTISYAGYTIGGERLFGASLVLQYSMFQSRSESIDLLGGVMFRFRNVADPVNIEDYAPLGIRDPYNQGESTRSMLRGIRFGLGMFGADYTIYLAEGDVRPYVGIGGMVMAFPYQGTIGSTIAPDVKAGLLVNLASGFSGFAEVKHVFGLPFTLGAPSTAFKDLTGFAFGLAFVPRFN